MKHIHINCSTKQPEVHFVLHLHYICMNFEVPLGSEIGRLGAWLGAGLGAYLAADSSSLPADMPGSLGFGATDS